jgi:hypothetical protein
VSRKPLRAKDRLPSGGYFALPHVVLDHENYTRLSAHACKLLNDLGSQFRGSNNGDLCMAWKLMKRRGWKSRQTLDQSRMELLHYGMVVVSRRGGRNKPTLYGITWLAIDECRGKLDIGKSAAPPGNWKTLVPTWDRGAYRASRWTGEGRKRQILNTPGVSESTPRVSVPFAS